METPQFLRRFDVDALMAEPSTLVALDTSGGIVWTNAAWTRFALANGGEDVPARFGVGTSYFQGISGELRQYFEDAFAACLVDDQLFFQDYECSTPELYRMHRLRLLPIQSSGLLLEHSRLEQRPHDRVPSPAIEADYRDANGIVLQCSNCRRTQDRSGAWTWVPSWVARSPARTSHGICKVCVGYYWGDRRRP